MMFTVSEFLAFARAVEAEEWSTLSQKKAYRYTVEDRGLRVTPSTGDERLVSNWGECLNFCV